MQCPKCGLENPTTAEICDCGYSFKPMAGKKLCPFCAEEIQAAAIVCKHCGRDLPKADATSAAAQPQRLSSEPTAFHDRIKSGMQQKNTAELLSIWQTNDRNTYSAETFNIIKEILVQREVDIPKQSQPDLINEQEAEKPPKGTTLNKRQIFAFCGCFLLAIGVFAPLVSVPIMGSINYFQNGKGDGVIVLILAGASLIAVLTKKYYWLWVTGIGSLATLAFTYFNFQSQFSDIKSQMATDLEGNPFRGIADMALQSIQMQWGWAVLIAGGAMLLIAAGLRDE